MTEPWLHVVGIGEEGINGLMPATRTIVEAADVIVGGERHHALSSQITAERVSWPSPFDDMIETLRGLKGRRAVVLVTGDPLWYSVGARIGRAINPSEIAYHPQLSAFQLVAARMGWSMADLETLTVHGRPAEQMIPCIQPGVRLIVLATGGETSETIARFLVERGYEQSRITAWAAMGGPDECRFDGMAKSWSHSVPAFNTLAIECVASPDALLIPRIPGLDDSCFHNDGTMTKQEIRASALAKLMPTRGALLWDIGTGCGSVAVEWMRAEPEARAIGIEPREDRRILAAKNATFLGTPKLELINGRAPDALMGLEPPDAVFIGGGLSIEVFQFAWNALSSLGRLACNAVTLESERLLYDLHGEYGGKLIKISVSTAEPVGDKTGWRPSMPVTQWSIVKR